MQSTIKDFFQFIYKRHMIWHFKNRLGLESPWTDDPILKKYKFCNIYRELDKCTIHLIDNVIKNENLSLEDKILNILIYRRFNTPDFFDVYGVQKMEIFNKDVLIDQMDAHKHEGNKLFSDAYIICQRSFESNYRKSDKHVQQIMLINKHAIELTKHIANFVINIEGLAYTIEETLPLTGGFLSYQYAIDISYLPEQRKRFSDLNSWCDVGPGAVGTIDMLFGKQKNKSAYMKKCIELFEMQVDYLQEDWAKIAYDSPYNDKPILSLNNIENACCEFRKYSNLSNGIGRKRYYKPQGA